MTKAFRYHIYGIQTAFEMLSKGKFLVFFIPGLIVGLFYYWAFFSTSSLSGAADSVKSWWLIGDATSSLINWVLDFIQYLLMAIFQFVVLTLLSPFNSALSEKYDTAITGTAFQSDIISFLNDMLRAILVAIIAIVLELFFMGIWWVLSVILPFSDILDPIMYFLIASFFFGFAFYDYSLERHRKGTFTSLGYAFSHIWQMIFTGAFFKLIFLIPFIGIIIAPVLSTMIATGVYIKTQEKPATTPTNN